MSEHPIIYFLMYIFGYTCKENQLHIDEVKSVKWTVKTVNWTQSYDDVRVFCSDSPPCDMMYTSLRKSCRSPPILRYGRLSRASNVDLEHS
jgi:hypothetical protein